MKLPKLERELRAIRVKLDSVVYQVFCNRIKINPVNPVNPVKKIK